MLVIRLYIVVLTVSLLCATSFTSRIGILEGMVIVGPIVFMILDMHVELRKHRELEMRIRNLSRSLGLDL